MSDAVRIPAPERCTREQLLSLSTLNSAAIWRWQMIAKVTRDSDPYAQAHSAAREWLRAYGTVDSEQAVRAWAAVHWTGHKSLVGATARGWHERLEKPQLPVSMDYEIDGENWLMCPYRYSQHGGASHGGGTWAAQYRKAWVYGEDFARRWLAVQP